MTRLDFDPDLDRLGQALRASTAIDLAREEQAARSADTPRRASLLRRPRAIAGGTLGLAGVGAALVLALGGTAATTPAFAITRAGDGSVLVHLNLNSSLPQVNDKLAAMGTHEQISIRMASGAASVSGPVTCARHPGASGPAVKVLDGPNGTEVISPGQTGDNTGVGTWHLAACTVYDARTTGGNPYYGEGNSGNS